MASLKPTDAFTTPGVFAPYTFSEVWCVEIMVMRADAAKVLRNRHRERRAFFRISRRTKLIQQHQRLRGRSARNEIDISHVRRKCRQVLLDRLVVADVGQHRVKHRQFGAIGRNRHSRLRHQRQQSHGFQRDSFAACVRAGDDQFAAARLPVRS